MSNSRTYVTHFFVVSMLGVVAFSQTRSREPARRDDAAIAYASGFLGDRVAQLNQQLLRGEARLEFDPSFGYLASLLQALQVPVESQMLVFSKTSLQSALISPGNPRAIYFNDAVSVAWVRGGPILEVAVQDAKQGIIFYTLGQDRQNRPLLARENVCLSCHDTGASLNAPGVLVRSVFPGMTGVEVTGLMGSAVDHRTPFDQRWGGWYVTGKRGPGQHLANAVVNQVIHAVAPTARPVDREPLPERFSTKGYPTPFSDVVALAVFEHQVHMMNLLTRLGWEARVAQTQDPAGRNTEVGKPIEDWAEELVDYMLFRAEAPMTPGIEGTSGFAEQFAALGPFDRKHRSLRQFNLSTRLMRYPCSYMIYSDAFDALPVPAREAIYRRLWKALAQEAVPESKAIVEILRDTREGLPDYFVADNVQ